MTKKILVIEDEQPLLEEILQTLHYEGYQVSGAPDGQVGLQMAQQEQPDLIISDIAMPVLDGYGVLEGLRKDPVIAATPLIFLTAKAEKTFMRQGMEMGADDYVTKPFTNAELLSAVRARLQRLEIITEVNLAQAEEMKQQLAQVIAHELRTPLVSITFVHDMLSEYMDTLEPQDMEEMLASLTYGTQRMSHVVEQMVLFTSLESGLLNGNVVQEYGTPVMLRSLLTSATDLGHRFVYRAVDAEIHLDRPDNDLYVRADKTALKHALAEVISNAIKFSPDRGDVVISCAQDAHWAWISVEDSGPGIPDDQREEALKPFTQIGRAKLEQQGIGLGLTLAKRVVDVHGGTLVLGVSNGHGTRVDVMLPRL